MVNLVKGSSVAGRNIRSRKKQTYMMPDKVLRSFFTYEILFDVKRRDTKYYPHTWILLCMVTTLLKSMLFKSCSEIITV